MGDDMLEMTRGERAWREEGDQGLHRARVAIDDTATGIPLYKIKMENNGIK